MRDPVGVFTQRTVMCKLGQRVIVSDSLLTVQDLQSNKCLFPPFDNVILKPSSPHSFIYFEHYFAGSLLDHSIHLE